MAARPSLNDVVSAMSSPKTENSTLNWDVVVNYAATELNKLLAAAHEKGGSGQLDHLHFTSTGVDPDGKPFKINYDFYCGAPVIQFRAEGVKPVCSVQIPITKGTAGSAEKPLPISPGAYSILVSDIPLATANATVGAARNPQDAGKPFQFPPDKDTTGVVTLHLGTTATTITVDIKLLDTSKKNIWMEGVFLQTDIRNALLDPAVGGSITWDIGHVTRKKIDSGSGVDNSLVPKSFQFATYAKKDDSESESILSLFIQTDTNRHGTVGEQLQVDWLNQWWTTYGVPPIPESYTASVIFNNDMLIGLMAKSTGMTFVPSSDEKRGLKLIVKTGQTFYVEKEFGKEGAFWTRHSEIDVNLDEEGKALRIAFDQKKDSVPDIMLNWDFTASMTWGTRWYKDSYWQNGTATITNKLQKQQNMDSSKLFKYEVHMDVGVSAGDWDTKIENDNHSAWDNFWTTFDQHIISGALPSALPSTHFKLLDFKFFMLTNLLLPGDKVIEFAKDGPGFRFPRDLYMVGQVVKQ